jgi:hypothetical protein
MNPPSGRWLSLRESEQRDWEIDTRRRIVIHNLPTDVPLSILTNAVGLFVSLPLRWSLKFVTMQDGSEHIEFYDYIHEVRVGRIRLASQRGVPRSRWFIPLCNGYGVLELVKGSKQVDTISSILAVLNDLVKKDPLQILNIEGKVVEAANMNFVVEVMPCRNDENQDPRNIQQCSMEKRLVQTSGDGIRSANLSDLPGKSSISWANNNGEGSPQKVRVMSDEACSFHLL